MRLFLRDGLEDEKLLGMDLLRLGLERGKSAKEAVDVITDLLEKYGQGGPYSNTLEGFVYHNSFLICDHKEAYILETVQKFWAVKRVTCGFRNISNILSIGSKIDYMSNGLKDKAIELGLWDGTGDFNFAKTFSTMELNECPRFENGSMLLEKHSRIMKFDAKKMFEILRDEDSGICMRDYGGFFVSTSSQVSVLHPQQSKRPQVHWFTGTPDPITSMFKPFIFTGNSPTVGTLLISPSENKPHRLYALHQNVAKIGVEAFNKLAEIEEEIYESVELSLQKIDEEEQIPLALDRLFQECAEREEKVYGSFLDLARQVGNTSRL